MARAKKCDSCGHRHKRGFNLCGIAKLAEEAGARVAWANDPDDMHHLIEFTPLTLIEFLAASK